MWGMLYVVCCVRVVCCMLYVVCCMLVLYILHLVAVWCGMLPDGFCYYGTRLVLVAFVVAIIFFNSLFFGFIVLAVCVLMYFLCSCVCC